ncbi:alpha-ketoglutarate dehydrogenase component 4 isoform X2 [Frankliniella occidentalis]|uniref:Alpha-ketoglutarate dehydrogenase component 4 isoform X2 n=1 Tax=Frankliniella occidentalis TaxID=133901 RepID=A0A6J1ST80_FRAOC|nr:alpha-ketoglutarate dehydrogenase component 4 isoform X2 [Frankliniella occidentalis]
MSLARLYFSNSLQRISILTDLRCCYSIQSVKPHVPLIKFRKGSPAHGHSAGSGSPSPGVAGSSVVFSRGTIEDYQLPSRYQRTPMDEKEIEYINRGGPE